MKQLINRDIELFYTKVSEETRLEKGMGVFEFERIKSLIDQYIPHPTSKIIDVGGGTGKYAAWLARKGHQVHMVEPVLKHIEQAKSRAERLNNKFTITRGASRKLHFPDQFSDLVLLHGPLYHLQKKADRQKTIQEARRVLKPGGIVLGFAINYAASTVVGLLQGLIHKKPFFEMCREELTTGIHNPPDDFPWLLTEAYYHRPEELRYEFEEEGFATLHLHAVEGMTWLDKGFFSSMKDKKKKARLMELIRATENDPYLLSFSPHMMIAVQKQ